MRFSNAFIPTLKENPKEAESVSCSLMLRAGLVRKFSSGIYAYLPFGFKVLKNITDIIREEMNKTGALELLLPALHPAEIWEKTGRNLSLKDILYTFKSPHGRNLVLGPTHEEAITDLLSREINSYKQLPLILYQIQTKFRDEPRPRSGIIRSLEFIMKDAYSFNESLDSLNESYNKMKDAYCSIFSRCGLPYVIAEADSGAMGGSVSHEFMAVSEVGEDKIVLCRKCGYSASLDVARCSNTADTCDIPSNLKKIEKISTPGITRAEDVSKFLDVTLKDLVKTIIYEVSGSYLAVLIRGDLQVNETKLKSVLKLETLKLADDGQIKKITGGSAGFSGPVDLKGVKIIADLSIKNMKNFVTGANKNGMHYKNVNIGRDFCVKDFYDIRFFNKDDLCPVCAAEAEIKNSIEIGHIFKLGEKYSKVFNACFLNKNMGKDLITMGCYGIGVSRLIAACVEANHDDKGIIWPESIAPFKVLILPVTEFKGQVKEVSEKIYKSLQFEGIDVLLDDRDERAGAKFKDADLLGLPFRIVIGSKNLVSLKVELQVRKNGQSELLSVKKCLSYITEYFRK